MGLLSHSLVTCIALAGVAPSAFAKTFLPRQATPGFSGCTYPEGWEVCNDADNRACWVTDPTGTEFNISTDYENRSPEGIERTYNIEITENPIAPDGTLKPLAKLINGQYPAPIIEACWGDTLIVNVKNSLPDNGTTIHWHGVRQLGSNQMDGVNGVTQCPTAQGESFQYKFKVTQYGHSWYHSHYSAQYPDGVHGGLLFHGPTSDNWDEEWAPIIVNDWVHNSSFLEFYKSLTFPVETPTMDSILVNGTGRFMDGGDYFRQKFEAGKRYLIRIINGSSNMHFQWSIDNHEITVVSSDFVAIEPYKTNYLSVGIGQRYSVIVEAKPDVASGNGKYWMRTEWTNDDACGGEPPRGLNGTLEMSRSGIISYDDAGYGDELPSTERHNVTIGCHDEPYDKLIPVVPWTVSAPANDVANYTYEGGTDTTNKGTWHGAVYRWSLMDNPLWLNFSDPLLLDVEGATENPSYAVVDYSYTSDEWVYMVITGGQNPDHPGPFNKSNATPHPTHLHGHDFAILAQSPDPWDPANPGFKLDNPPRRDSAMLPSAGYLAIAYKPDNPGAWVLHCHIAWHAGSGMAFNVLERPGDIPVTVGDLGPNREGCKKWDSWTAAHPGVVVQDDSGI